MIQITADLAKAAAEAKRTAPVGRSWGACRCYVTFDGKLTAQSSKALGAAGFKVFQRPRHKGKHIYIGYDNFSGREYAQAEVVAAALKAAGVSCYADADGD